MTGARSALDTRARETVNRVRSVTEVPVAVGFGISSARQVSEVREFADGVVVGSALLNAIAGARAAKEVAQRAVDFLGPLLEAAHG